MNNKTNNSRTLYEKLLQNKIVEGDVLKGGVVIDGEQKEILVNVTTWKWTCSDGTSGDAIDLYQQVRGISRYEDALHEVLNEHSITESVNSNTYSLPDYAAEIGVPEEILKSKFSLCTKTDKTYGSYVEIPYIDDKLLVQAVRRRFSEKLCWQRGSKGKINLYGKNLLPAIHKNGYVVLVSGEKIVHTFSYMGIPVLGVPENCNYKPGWTGAIEGLKVYILKKSDRSGEHFLQSVERGLQEGGYEGSVHVISCPEGGAFDPSDALIKLGREKAVSILNELIDKAEEVDLNQRSLISELLPDVPVPLYQPQGWEVSDKGIFRFKETSSERELCCRTPLIITQRLRNLESEIEKIEIAFKRDGCWIKGIYQRSLLFTSRGILALADAGCMVTSENARNLVRYLADLEAENTTVIRRVASASVFGWQNGTYFIPGNSGDIILDIDESFRARAAAYSNSGSLDEWICIMAKHRERNSFRAILAASFAAPLLRIVKQRSFILYNWGNARGGKTAALKAALSVWGDPERLMMNFNATQVGLERSAGFYNDLPLGIDERQLVGGNQEFLEKIVYMLASGMGKTRGAKTGGIQKTYLWRTIALATGEEPIVHATSQSGVNTRMLEIKGGPFDNENQASQIHRDCSLHYGWAGPEYIRALVQIPEEKIRESYAEIMEYVTQISDGKTGSHIGFIALIALADVLADMLIFSGNCQTVSADTFKMDCFSLDRAKEMAKSILMTQIPAETGDVNQHAVQYVMDWITSNRAAFDEYVSVKRLGFTNPAENMIYILPSAFREALEKGGYSERKTLEYMAQKGYIKTTLRKDNGGINYRVNVRRNSTQQKVVAIYLDKVSADLTADEVDEEDHNNLAECPSGELNGGAPEVVEHQIHLSEIYGKIEDDGFRYFLKSEDMPFAEK